MGTRPTVPVRLSRAAVISATVVMVCMDLPAEEIGKFLGRQFRESDDGTERTRREITIPMNRHGHDGTGPGTAQIMVAAACVSYLEAGSLEGADDVSTAGPR